MRRFIYLMIAITTMLSVELTAQEADSIFVQGSDTFPQELMAKDSLLIDSLYRSTQNNEALLIADSSRAAKKRNTVLQEEKIATRFNPDPNKATWLAVVFPGAGQIYNKKYWKLPIVYGGFMGCLYAYNWNNQMYSDYRQAYLDIMDADPNTHSYEDFFRPGYDFERNKEYMKEVFKKRKDRYRRWRDLSVFAFVGVYLISVIDAYVDAQLSNFDISEDLNLSINPEFMRGNTMGTDGNYYGLNCNISF